MRSPCCNSSCSISTNHFEPVFYRCDKCFEKVEPKKERMFSLEEVEQIAREFFKNVHERPNFEGFWKAKLKELGE